MDVADGAEDDIDEILAEVGGAVDDGTEGLANVGTVVVATVTDIVFGKALRAVHGDGPQKLNVNARRWLLRGRHCYRSSW